MQGKFEMFKKLPPELELSIAENLSSRDLVNLAQTSDFNLRLFKPMVDVRKLLHYVVHGNNDAVQSILTDDISLMLRRGRVADCSGRAFESISGFEYALWALDKHMWAKMIACIPKNEEGRNVFEQLLTQYNKVNTDGITYRLNGKTITEKHFDLENSIIKELQTQVDLINAPGDKNWDPVDKQWREGVGGAQKLFPMHVVDEYCSNEPFYPVPKFTSQPKLARQFYNWTTGKDENWFSSDSKLSVDFAIYKGPLSARGRSTACVAVFDDLDAMTALCKVRTNDFIDLKSQLEDQMTLDNRHQVPHI